jgi:hypothetical protein
VDKRITKTVNKIDGQIKNASIFDIGLLFDAVRGLFSKQLRESLIMTSPQAILLINIQTRDKSYGKRVPQVLIIAPNFSSDFVESAELDADINTSLLETGGLKLILDTFRARRKSNFSSKLLTKGGLLKAKLIAKNI